MEKLGINPLIIIAQIVNFGILVFILNRYLYKPVMKAVRAKQDEFDQIDKGKQSLDKLKETTERERENIIRLAQKDRETLVAAARAKAEKDKKDLIAKAQLQAKSLIDKAKKDIEAEKAELQKNFEKEVLSAALAINEKVVKDEKSRANLRELKAQL